jgi:hypothetical protein
VQPFYGEVCVCMHLCVFVSLSHLQVVFTFATNVLPLSGPLKVLLFNWRICAACLRVCVLYVCVTRCVCVVSVLMCLCVCV